MVTYSNAFMSQMDWSLSVSYILISIPIIVLILYYYLHDLAQTVSDNNNMLPFKPFYIKLVYTSPICSRQRSCSMQLFASKWPVHEWNNRCLQIILHCNKCCCLLYPVCTHTMGHTIISENTSYCLLSIGCGQHYICKSACHQILQASHIQYHFKKSDSMVSRLLVGELDIHVLSDQIE